MKPILAAPIKNVEDLVYPLYLSPKLDGVRALVKDGVVLSRSLKPIPNAFVQKRLGNRKYNGLDGELIVGDPTDEMVYRNTTSGVMSQEGKPCFTFYAFDDFSNPSPFQGRLAGLHKMFNKSVEPHPFIHIVPHHLIRVQEELEMYEEKYLEDGFEGIMLRKPEGIYKYGRSTVREGHLMKFKRFVDSEAIILDMLPLQHNENPAERNALGNLERSSKKAGMVASDQMGTLMVQDAKTKVKFGIGSGFTQDERKVIWLARESFIGKIVKYRYQPTGVKDKPRFPVYLGFRDSKDL